MSEAAADHRLVLSDGTTDPEAGIMHAASPFMIGLVAAVIGMSLLAPGVVRYPHLIVSALLVPSLIVTVGLYAWSVISPGEIVGLVVDRADRTVELVQSNSFASRRTRLAFDQIARVSIEQSYDRDGYGTRNPVITLSTGERLPLAFTMDERWILELRRAFGLGPA